MTLRVDYYFGLTECVSEWWCVEHERGSWAHDKAVHTWREASKYERAYPPSSAEVAAVLARTELRQPRAIKVLEKAGARFPEIVEKFYEGEKIAEDAQELAERTRGQAQELAEWERLNDPLGGESEYAESENMYEDNPF